MLRIRLIVCTLLLPPLALSQEQIAKPFGRVGLGVKLSSLGAGTEATMHFFSRSNLRTGFNYFIYDHDLSDGGVGYRGKLNLCSAQVTYDWYPFRRSFHLSPTVLIYNATHVSADLSVPAGTTFSITKGTYKSDPSDPISGTASLKFPKVAPGFLIGWGNLISHGRHRVSFPFELGFVFEGTPHVSLNLNGSGCDPGGRGCSSLSSDPTATRNIRSEQAKLAREVTFLRFYPIISIGVGYRF